MMASGMSDRTHPSTCDRATYRDDIPDIRPMYRDGIASGIPPNPSHTRHITVLHIPTYPTVCQPDSTSWEWHVTTPHTRLRTHTMGVATPNESHGQRHRERWGSPPYARTGCHRPSHTFVDNTIVTTDRPIPCTWERPDIARTGPIRDGCGVLTTPRHVRAYGPNHGTPIIDHESSIMCHPWWVPSLRPHWTLVGYPATGATRHPVTPDRMGTAMRNVIITAAIAIGIVLGTATHALSTSNTAPPVPATTTDACDRIDWHATDRDGQPFTPTDINHDNMIDCTSDIELGA